MPTRSFAEIYARHEGPYLVSATLPGEDGGLETEKFGKRMDAYEAHSLALHLLAASEGILGIVVWSLSEEQVACSYRRSDVGTTAPGPPDPIIEAEQVERIRKERSAARAEEQRSEFPRDATADEIDGVVKLRAAGMGYVAIEKEFGRSKKGFWAWKIIKALEARVVEE